MTVSQQIITIAAVVLGTMVTRFLPFLPFPEGKTPPAFVTRLGAVLPFAVIGLLVDTYNVLKSGVPNAIRVFKEVLLPRGITKCGIRLDSGDLTYLSQKARQMLDEAGLTDCKIFASNALDEYIIRDLVRQGARIDSFGVGERLITSRSEPVFGGVYKLAAIEDEQGNIIPKIKISENPAKITTPHFKKVYRLFSRSTGKAEVDLICLHDEQFDFSQPEHAV